MIQVIEINNISLGTSDTYGYFSLGDIKIEKNETTSLLDSFDSVLECSCMCDGLKFKAIVIKNGLFNRYTVLSDFQKLPDYAVIENEEVLMVVKESIKDYISKEERNQLLTSVNNLLSPTGVNYYSYDINSSLFTPTSKTH